MAETPGSWPAIALGCLCPREQPQGVQGLYWQNAGCPLHDCTPSTQEQDND